MTDWEAILREDGPAVWRAARRIVGNDADADECYQEAFLAALEYSRKKQVLRWRPLLVRIATARAIDRIRRRIRCNNRQEQPNWNDIQSGAPIPPDRIEQIELAERLRQVLLQLYQQQAEVFCLACLDGWSHRQIADELAMTVGSVGVTVHRARRKLSGLLGSITEVWR